MRGLFLLMAYSYVPWYLVYLSTVCLNVNHRQRSFESFDGVILSSTEAYEQEAIDHITQWQNESSKEVYTLGPLLPVDSNPIGDGGIQNDTTEEIQQFLDTTLETDGPCSVLYVSWTVPTRPIHTRQYSGFEIDVLMSTDFLWFRLLAFPPWEDLDLFGCRHDQGDTFRALFSAKTHVFLFTQITCLDPWPCTSLCFHTRRGSR